MPEGQSIRQTLINFINQKNTEQVSDYCERQNELGLKGAYKNSYNLVFLRSTPPPERDLPANLCFKADSSQEQYQKQVQQFQVGSGSMPESSVPPAIPYGYVQQGPQRSGLQLTPLGGRH